MIIIGCDFHTRYQQIAMMEEATAGVDRAAIGSPEQRGRRVLSGVAGCGARGDRNHRPDPLV